MLGIIYLVGIVISAAILTYVEGRSQAEGNLPSDAEPLVFACILWPICVTLAIIILPFVWLFSKGQKDGKKAKQREKDLQKKLERAEKDKLKAEQLQREAEEELERILAK